MIHNVLLLDIADRRAVARAQFWAIEFSEADISEFIEGLLDIRTTSTASKEAPFFVGHNRVYHREISPGLVLLFCTDATDEARSIENKLSDAALRISRSLSENGLGFITRNFRTLLGDSVFTRFKVSFVGSGGVGKSTLLRLLFGKDPAPGGYIPTINVSIDSSLFIEFGTFHINVWDFAGQTVFQDRWSFYFRGTDIIYLVSDSSFQDVYTSTKSILKRCREEAPSVPVYIVANKQDLPESMPAKRIQRLLGVETLPMVASDSKYRERFLKYMIRSICESVGIEVPDYAPIIRHGEEKDTEAKQDLVLEGPSVPKVFLLIGVSEHERRLIYSIDYEGSMTDVRSIVSLLRAVDASDSLTSIGHKDSTIMVERSDRFIAALYVTNKGTPEYRSILQRIIGFLELRYISMGEAAASWSNYESSIDHLLQDLPVALLDPNHILEPSLEGVPMVFEGDKFNANLSGILDLLDRGRTVREIVDLAGMPLRTSCAILQLMIAYGWALYADARSEVYGET